MPSSNDCSVRATFYCLHNEELLQQFSVTPLIKKFPVCTKRIFHYPVQEVIPLGLILSQFSFHFTPRKCKFSHTICSTCSAAIYTGFYRTAILLSSTGLHLCWNLHIILLSNVLHVVESVFSFYGDNYGTTAARSVEFDTEVDLKRTHRL